MITASVQTMSVQQEGLVFLAAEKLEFLARIAMVLMGIVMETMNVFNLERLG